MTYQIKVYNIEKKEYWSQIAKYVAEENPNGDWLEFGVWKGNSAKRFLEYLPRNSRLYLFDSFKGLPENWKPGFPKGKFSLSSPPSFNDDRVTLIKGMFEDKLPNWINNYYGNVSLIHLDCDIFSSARFVLSHIDSLISADTVVLLDDFAGNKDCYNHVFNAFRQYLLKNNYQAKIIGRTKSFNQAAIKVIKSKDGLLRFL